MSDQTPLKLGRFNLLKVSHKAPQGFYLLSSHGEILLPNKYAPANLKEDDTIRVFIYKDSEDRLIATTLKPYGQEGDFVALFVADVSPHGAFLDWGLEKDLFVPNAEQHKNMKLGEKHLVRICIDPQTERLIGVAKLSYFLDKDTSELDEGQEVDLLVYEYTTIGVMCIVNQRYSGMLYKNELFRTLEVGEQLKGYIKQIREDGKLDLSIRRVGFKGVVDQLDVILEKLARAKGGFLPFHDGSSPDLIEQEFQMSKKTFKKVIGILFRQGKITLAKDGISLKKKAK